MNGHKYLLSIALKNVRISVGCGSSSLGTNAVDKRIILKIPGAILVLVFLIGGCAFDMGGGHKSVKEQALDQIKYVSTPEQRGELKKLESDEDVNRYLEDFWRKLDPIPETRTNELREIYLSRVRFANEYFHELNLEGFETDRGRVYIIYGPPDEVIDVPMPDYLPPTSKYNLTRIENRFYSSQAKSAQMWVYQRPAGNVKIPAIYTIYNYSCMSFVFADLEGFGSYVQVYSTEEGEVVSGRIY